MKTKEDLIKWSKKDIEIIAKKELVINGEPLSEQLVYSEPFSIEYPPNNVFDANPGPIQLSHADIGLLCALYQGGNMIFEPAAHVLLAQ